MECDEDDKWLHEAWMKWNQLLDTYAAPLYLISLPSLPFPGQENYSLIVCYKRCASISHITVGVQQLVEVRDDETFDVEVAVNPPILNALNCSGYLSWEGRAS